MRHLARVASSCLIVLTVVVLPSEAQRPGGGRGGVSEPRQANGGGEETASKIKPYDEVITDKAESDPGLFLVHRLEDKVYYEIPLNQLDRDMLWVTQIEKTQAGFGYGGTPAGDRVVRWELRGESILLRDVKYQIRADVDDSIKTAVDATSVAPIIKTFQIAAWGKDQRPVIDVTELLTGDISEFSVARRLSASGVDSSRTFIEGVKSFPENIESKVLMTYRISSGGAAAGGGFPRGGGARRDPSQSGVTVLVHHSMLILPAHPMQPRLHDSRVGFFSVGFEDYGSDAQEVDDVRYITRWRLEKQDPGLEVSDPVKPIVFYVGRGVPDKWKPYVKKGIEMWQPAFEAAGFSNAIRGEYAPSEEEDPDWDAEDARISSIRWLPSTVENAMGPHVNDPRTGEILEADILVYHNVLKLVRDWYFVQASPSDPRAQSLPLPDDLLGECLAYVIAHEVGHSLGFPHNMKASSSYTVEQLRDAEFTAKYGTEASIMDYGRFNYVAQPGDGATLIPKVGPYDFFAVEWGYKQYADSKTEEEGLAAIVARQKDDRTLLFGGGNAWEDPTDQTEDLGMEKIDASRLGLLNLDRVAGYLVEATCKEGEDYDLLENMYGELLGQRNRELGHVANIVGGFDVQNFWFGDAEQRYFPVSADLQREAVEFLNQNAFQVPASLTPDDILFRLESSGTADRFVSLQQGLLRTLLNDARIKRMAELTERRPEDAYPPRTLVNDLTQGIFSELQESVVTVNLYRRNLQRAYVQMLIDLMETEAASTDLPAIARGELQTLLGRFSGLNGHVQHDDMTRMHFADLSARITNSFERPVVNVEAGGGAAATPPVGRRGLD